MDTSPNQRPQAAPRPGRAIAVGLLGGIASGKSTVARLFADAGLTWIDADRMAKEAMATTEVQEAIRGRFGPEVFAADGSVDRKRLASRVFADPEARRALEAMIHPRVRGEILARLERELAAGRSVLLDVPLLLENGLIERCDACVFVEASAEVRRQRALERGWSLEELERREQAQAPLAVKKARCAYTIRNEGSLHDTARQVQAVLLQLG